jgi:solute:Na+ symporter, SSS family
MSPLRLACPVITIVLSRIRPHEHTSESEKLVRGSPLDTLRGETWKGVGNYKFIVVVLVIVMIALYIVFA